jgi:hypothetical protein
MEINHKTPLRLYRLISLCLFTLLALPAHSCVMKFYFGPYVDLDYAYSVAKDFIAKTHRDTSCYIALTPSSTLEEFYMDILTVPPPLIALDEYSAPVFEQRGYKGLFTTENVIQTYLIANTKKVPIQDGKYDLSNIKIIGPSQYDNAHTFAKDYLKNLGLNSQILTQAADNLSTNIVTFFKQDIDAIVTESFIYDRLPNIIRNKYEIIAKSEKRSTTIMVRNDIKDKVIEAMKRNVSEFNILPYKVHSSYSESPHTLILRNLIEQLEIERKK